MALTEKQKNNIMNLDADTLAEIMHECADQFMRVQDYHDVTGMPVRTIYDKIASKELKSIEIFGIKVIYP